MWRPCPYCRKKKPHFHKRPKDLGTSRILVTPIKKKPKK